MPTAGSTSSHAGAPWPQTTALLLLADGRAITLARNAAPVPEVVTDTAARLAGLGLAGWLVAAEFHRADCRPRLRRLRQLCQGQGAWEAAEAAFIAARKASQPAWPLL